MLELALTRYEFLGVDDQVHSFSGCSLVGRLQFASLHQDLRRLIERRGADDPDGTLEDFYQASAEFRGVVDLLLSLNGINPAWVSWAQCEQLLISRETESPGLWLPGILVEINSSQGAVAAGSKPAALPDLLGAIAVAVGGIEPALRLAQTLPAQDLLEILNAYVESQKAPEQKAQESFEDWKKKVRAEAGGNG